MCSFPRRGRARKGDGCVLCGSIVEGLGEGSLRGGGLALRPSPSREYVQLIGSRAHAGSKRKKKTKRLLVVGLRADATGLKWIGVVAVQVDGAESGVDDSNNRRDRVQSGGGRTGEWEGMGEGKGKSWGVGGYWLCAQPLAQGVRRRAT